MLAWLLTDETYAVISTLPPGTPPRQQVQIALLNHGWWVLGTLVGALLGTRFTQALTGIDFALVALFAVLVVEQWRATRRVLPFGVAALAYALAAGWCRPRRWPWPLASVWLRRCCCRSALGWMRRHDRRDPCRLDHLRHGRRHAGGGRCSASRRRRRCT